MPSSSMTDQYIWDIVYITKLLLMTLEIKCLQPSVVFTQCVAMFEL